MYESIRIQNFRGLKDLTIENLGRVNLLVGANNVGKTSVLEALALLRMHDTGYEFAEILESRGFDGDESLRESVTSVLNWHDDYERYASAVVTGWWESNGEGHRLAIAHDSRGHMDGFHEVGELLVSVVSARDEHVELTFGKRPREATGPLTAFRTFASRGTRTLQISPGSLRPFPTAADVGPFGQVALVSANHHLGPSALAELVSEIQNRGLGQELIDALGEFDSRVSEVNVRFERVDRRATVTVGIRDESGWVSRLPITSLGDGLRRIVELRLLLPLGAGGLGLIDEVESGIYYRNLTGLWRSLSRTSKAAELQLFATTHSWECVEAAVEAFEDEPDAFRLHRLERRGGDVVAVTYEHRVALAAVDGLVEVR